MYLFIYFWLHRVLVVACGIFVAACRIFVAACSLLSCGMWASQLRHACRNYFPDQGTNPGPHIGSTESYPLDHQGGP